MLRSCRAIVIPIMSGYSLLLYSTPVHARHVQKAGTPCTVGVASPNVDPQLRKQGAPQGSGGHPRTSELRRPLHHPQPIRLSVLGREGTVLSLADM